MDSISMIRIENQIQELIVNASSSRSEFFTKFFDPRRDIDDECGYPKVVSKEQYRLLWDRDPIANRVVNVLPKESWQVSPEVFESEGSDDESEFDIAWKSLPQNLRGASWFKQSTGNPIWEALMRADILSGIGSFGVLLLGIDDGKELDQPVDGIDAQGLPSGKPSDRKLLYLRSFDESLVQVTEYERDVKNRRYSQPTAYLITFNDLLSEDAAAHSGIGISTQTKTVHWTRVIHIADNLGSSETFGAPRMKANYNRLYDLVKLYSGSAEMYWRGAFPGLSLETHPQLGGDVQLNPTALKGMMTDYANGLQRWFALAGMTAKSLAPQVVDPTAQINVQLEALCIQIAVPMRVFKGSERGELASSQDDDAWNDRLKNRQDTYVTPRIIVPFVDRLIMIGCLPEPGEEGYKVVWPDLSSLSDNQRADIALKRTQALAQYSSQGVQSLVTFHDFLTRILNFTMDEATAMIDAAVEQSESEDGDGTASPLLSMVGGITGMTQIMTLMAQGGISPESTIELIKIFYGLDQEQAEAIVAEGPPAPQLPVGPDGMPLEEPAPGEEADPFAEDDGAALGDEEPADEEIPA